MTDPVNPGETDPERLAAILDGLREGFQIIDTDWTYVYVNPVAAAHGRYTPQDLVGRKMSDVYPGIERTKLFARLQHSMRERIVQTFENHFTFPDGTTRWFEIRVQPISEGICVYSRDIERRKAREQKDQADESEVAGRVSALLAMWKNMVGGSADSWR